MGLSVWSLIAYVLAIILWNAVLKRNIGEAMGIGCPGDAANVTACALKSSV
jgi:hypothetical protein